MRRLAATPALLGLGLVLLALGLWRIDASPERIWNGLSRLGWLVALMWPPSPGGALWELLHGLAESLAMAFLGTLIAALVALPLALLGAGNVVGNLLLRFSVRRLYDGLRGIDTLIWALIFVSAVGMGPFAGILAIAMPDIGTFAKLFSEALEGADRRQVEAVRAAGSGRVLAVRFGLLPQVAPVMLSQVLYMLESNARSSTVLGIVGAGGIGGTHFAAFKRFDYDFVCAILISIIALIFLAEVISGRIRAALR